MKRSQGFTLMEIMIVVAVIGLLAAIAFPAYFRARENSLEKACVNNLRLIHDAKDQYAMDHYNATPALGDMVPDYITKMPQCPGAGAYTVGALGADPTCNVSGHTI